MIYMQPLLRGLVLTLQVFVYAAAISTVCGVLVGVMLDSAKPWVRRVARTYSALLRGLPPLTVMLLVYLGFPELGIKISSVTTAVVAICSYGSAYVGEIIAGALKSIESDIRDSTKALGIGYTRALLRVYLPSSYRVAAPAYFTEMTELLKDTAIAGVVGVIELTTAASTGAAASPNPLTISAEAAVMYAILGSILLLFQVYAERKNPGRSLRSRLLRRRVEAPPPTAGVPR